MDKQTLLQSFQHPEEKLAFSKVLDNAFICEKQHKSVFSDFLDPFKVSKFCSVFERWNDLSVHMLVYGGTAEAERKQIGFWPVWEEPRQELFPIRALQVSYNERFSRKLSHRDFLGSILALGIDRGKVGDIFVDADSAIVFVHRDMAGFLCDSMQKVANASVLVRECADDELEMKEPECEESTVSVSSLRLDAVISAIFHMSRTKSAAWISSEKVFVNGLPAADGAKLIREKDRITLRGMGRALIAEIAGETRKGRTILLVERNG